mmetsp:Transcript_22085/g.51870  ORF Transcript_22085/g.51870 Transcript_22085/m.51870 type:complete len:255 (-) Transcript_22085:78-842(-)
MRFSAFGALVLLVLHLLCAATRDADLEVQRSRVLQVLAGAQKARQREEEVGLDLDRPGADFRHSVQGGRDLYKEQSEDLRLERQLAVHLDTAEAREVLHGQRFSSAVSSAAEVLDGGDTTTQQPAETSAQQQNESAKEDFQKAGEDSEKVKEDVEKVESATHDAQEKSKKVDKDFAKEDEKIKKLDETLKRLSQKTFRWQEEILQYFEDVEGPKYSPLMNIKLDRSRDRSDRKGEEGDSEPEDVATSSASPQAS